MSLIQNPIAEARLRAFTQNRGGHALAPILASEISPVILVEDLTRTYDPVSIRPFFAVGLLTPGALNFAKVGLRCIGRDIIGLIDRIRFTVTITAPVEIQLTQATLANLAGTHPPAYTDGRIAWNTQPVPPFEVRSEDTVTSPFGKGIVNLNALANTLIDIEFDYPLILTNGNTVLVEVQTVNIPLRASFAVREIARPL